MSSGVQEELIDVREYKTKKYCLKRQRENSVWFHKPSSSPSLLGAVAYPSFSGQNGNSLQEAPPVEALDSVVPELCTAGGGVLHRRQQLASEGISHLSPFCPTPRDRLLWLLRLARGFCSCKVLITNSHQLNCCRGRKERDRA